MTAKRQKDMTINEEEGAKSFQKGLYESSPGGNDRMDKSQKGSPCRTFVHRAKAGSVPVWGESKELSLG